MRDSLVTVKERGICWLVEIDSEDSDNYRIYTSEDLSDTLDEDLSDEIIGSAILKIKKHKYKVRSVFEKEIKDV